MEKREFLKILFLVAFAIQSILVFSQKESKTKSNAYNVFYYENGNISSEGSMRNGKPDGYWKNYYENAVLKSEGNRKDYMLDSIWKFYSYDGRLNLEISYKNGKKMVLGLLIRKMKF